MHLALFLFLVAPLVVQSDDILVSAPGVLKLGVPNNIFVNLVSSSQQNLTIEASNDGKQLVALENKTVNPGSSTLLTLQIDASKIDGGHTGSPCNGRVRLLVQCSALGLRRELDVGVECSGASIYVSTDKTVYTPGQTVSLRVACLNWQLISYKEKLTIDVKNPTGIIVRRWVETSSKSRLIDMTFTIDEEPILGWWAIEVYPEEDSAIQPLGTSKFEVNKYVVSRFGVAIESPGVVQSSMHSFIVTVRAKYTYGKEVKGRAFIEYGVLYENTYRPIRKDWSKSLRNGEAIYNITLEYIISHLPYGFPNGGRLKVQARVTSDGIGLVEKATSENTVFSVKSVLIDTSRSRRYFKPGLPYDLEILARRPNGSPIKDVPITLQAFMKKQDELGWNRIEFTLGITQTRMTKDNGYIQFTINTPKNSTKLKVQVQAAGNAWTETEIFAETSSWEDKYLLIRDTHTIHKVCSKLPCSQEHFEVYSSDSHIQVILCYVLICRGVVMQHKCRSVSSWPTQVSIELLPYTSPCCKLLVYYQQHNFLVADFTTVYSHMQFPNEISIKAVEDRPEPFYAPGDTVNFEISGISRSTVYLSAVDEGALSLGDNRLTALEVFNRLRGCTLGCYVTGGRDVHDIFKNAGLVYTTLTKGIHYSPICFPLLKVEPTLANLEECCERGRKHCKNCEAQAQQLRNESIHSDECIEAFSRCCQIASEQTSCTFEFKTGEKAQLKCCHVYSRRARTSGGTQHYDANFVLPVTYRTYFPESWLRKIYTIGDSGVTKVSVNLPHTITTWRIYALGVSQTGLYGMANPISLRVYSPIFLEVSLPYSVVRNEQFAVKATVFNYNERVDLTDISVQLRSRSFDVCTTAGIGKFTEKLNLALLKAKSSHTFVFAVVPLTLGKIQIEVIMTTFYDKEIVTRAVRVEPEGIEQEISHSNALDPSANGGVQQFTYNLVSPKNTVKDSSRSYCYVTGNALGPVVALEGFDELLQQPYGCGEQNMITFCLNVIVLIYLNRTGQLTPSLLEKGVINIHNGYSRQLMFRRTRPPGSFSAFGDSDYHGSTWLTAFVLKCFCQVKHVLLSFTIIDITVIKTGLQWLSTQQIGSGEFEERGRVIDSAHQGGVQAQKCSLTAFVLISYLECSFWSRDTSMDLEPAVCLATTFIVNCLKLDNDRDRPDPCSNTFELAVSGYALCLAKERCFSKERRHSEKRYSAKAIGRLWQCANVNLRAQTVDWVDRSPTRAVAVETSAYALLAFLCHGDLQSASLIANWLNQQRGLGGGFVSTQDTIISIQALAAYAEKRFGKNSQLTVTINSQSKKSSSPKTISISGSDANIRHTLPVQYDSMVTVSVRGSGTGLLQCGVKYNSLSDTNGYGFILTVNTRTVSEEKLSLKIIIRYTGIDMSGMAVATVHILSGFEASVEIPQNDSKIKRDESRGQIVNIYFFKDPSQDITFEVHLSRKENVGFIQPAPIRVYDYYNPDVHATKFYAPGSESPLLALLCRGGSCQCGAGKCPFCDKLVGMRSVDKESTSCPNMDSTDGGRRSIKWEILEKEHCTHDFSYLFTVTKVGQDNCINGWKKIQGRIEEIFKPGIRDFVVGDKIRLFKRVNCRCPSFIKGQSYLYIGNDGYRFLVDYHAVVLKWEKKRHFNTYLSFLKDRGACEDY